MERSAGPAAACGGAVPDGAAAGGGRTKKEAGISNTQTRVAIMSCAARQSVHEMSQAANGERVSGATPTPTDTSDTARLRWRSNHPITAAIIGSKKLPAATPTSRP